jgi:transposase
MGKPYSQDLRERVLGAIDDGGDAYEIAPLFNVSVSYIYKILARRRITGETTARGQRHGPLPKLAPYNDVLRARIERSQTRRLTNYARGFCPSTKSRSATPVCGSNWAALASH